MRTNLWWLAGILAVAPAIGHETSEDLGTKSAGEHLKAEGSLPPGGVADSGKAVNQGGFIWTQENFLKYNSLVREKDSIGKHTSVFAGKWHYSGGAGEAKQLDWKHTAQTEITDRKVVVNWRDHPGAKIVLNNGNCHDTFWGDEQGKWPNFYGYAIWRHFYNGTQIADEVAWHYGDDYNLNPKNTTQTGNHKITLTYYNVAGKTIEGEYEFNVVEPVTDIKLRKIRDTKNANDMLGRLVTYPLAQITANVEHNIQMIINATFSTQWSQSQSNEVLRKVVNTTSVNGSVNYNLTGTIGVGSIKFGEKIDVGSEMEIATATTKKYGVELSQSSTFSYNTQLSPVKPINPWEVYTVFLDVAYQQHDYSCKYLADINPKDGFPDFQTPLSVNFSTIKPYGLRVFVELSTPDNPSL